MWLHGSRSNSTCSLQQCWCAPPAAGSTRLSDNPLLCAVSPPWWRTWRAVSPAYQRHLHCDIWSWDCIKAPLDFERGKKIHTHAGSCKSTQSLLPPPNFGWACDRVLKASLFPRHASTLIHSFSFTLFIGRLLVVLTGLFMRLTGVLTCWEMRLRRKTLLSSSVYGFKRFLWSYRFWIGLEKGDI